MLFADALQDLKFGSFSNICFGNPGFKILLIFLLVVNGNTNIIMAELYILQIFLFYGFVQSFWHFNNDMIIFDLQG